VSWFIKDQESGGQDLSLYSRLRPVSWFIKDQESGGQNLSQV
jgi:hypothetical protein